MARRVRLVGGGQLCKLQVRSDLQFDEEETKGEKSALQPLVVLFFPPSKPGTREKETRTLLPPPHSTPTLTLDFQNDWKTSYSNPTIYL